MTSFSINVEEVRGIADLIGQTAGELRGSSTIGDSPPILAGGDPLAGTLHNAVSGFFHNWSDGMTKISGHLQDIDDALHNATAAYSTTEDKIVAAATPTT